LIDHETYLAGRPSLVVIDPDSDPQSLTAYQPVLSRLRLRLRSDGAQRPDPQDIPWPVLVGLREPDFVRRLPGRVKDRLEALSLPRVEVLALWIEDPQDLKGGGLLQALFDLRDTGVTRYIGLVCRDAPAAEWLAMNSAVRVLGVPFHLSDQSARYRALPTAAEHGMACLALGRAAATTAEGDEQAIRHALGDSARALPVLDAPIPAGLQPMTGQELDQCWETYRASHDEPPPLPRGRPPGE
jgi:hypothetical protein